jgi:hypothetical protein
MIDGKICWSKLFDGELLEVEWMWTRRWSVEAVSDGGKKEVDEEEVDA